MHSSNISLCHRDREALHRRMASHRTSLPAPTITRVPLASPLTASLTCESPMESKIAVDRFKSFMLVISHPNPMPALSGVSEKRNEHTFRWEDVHSVVGPQIREDGNHVWPFNPAFPLDVRSFAFRKARIARLTRHDYCELLYVHSGEARYQIRDREFIAKRNDLIVINGAGYHRLNKVLQGPFKVVVLYFLPTVLRTFDAGGEDIAYLMPFLLQDEQFPNLIPSKPGLQKEILDLIVRIQELLPATGERPRLAARTYLQMIMVHLINHYKNDVAVKEAFEKRERTLQRMRALFDFVEDHYQEPITLARATAVVGMSKAHFMRSFKKVTGQSFDTYLNHFRIHKAQALLASSDKPIFTVSREVGFCDQSYFGLVFRRLVRVTPREYRRQFS